MFLATTGLGARMLSSPIGISPTKGSKSVLWSRLACAPKNIIDVTQGRRFGGKTTGVARWVRGWEGEGWFCLIIHSFILVFNLMSLHSELPQWQRLNDSVNRFLLCNLASTLYVSQGSWRSLFTVRAVHNEIPWDNEVPVAPFSHPRIIVHNSKSLTDSVGPCVVLIDTHFPQLERRLTNFSFVDKIMNAGVAFSAWRQTGWYKVKGGDICYCSPNDQILQTHPHWGCLQGLSIWFEPISRSLDNNI